MDFTENPAFLAIKFPSEDDRLRFAARMSNKSYRGAFGDNLEMYIPNKTINLKETFDRVTYHFDATNYPPGRSFLVKG